ncbi:RNA-binding domain-containing protein [Exidia glandulosa HHB12029]|uniref:RNA-binding domain-containing protein n=1 Tax=Exidia glandulosa HHB12029 TaxID=1314781 RepID=A0A165JLA3_EXIGL|nr:RNA-binding domain-containing protein [Exidia glandulosa HHB12029]
MNFDYLQEALPQTAPPAQSSTLCFSNLEPWMDEEYVKRLCSLMKWDGVSVKIPQPAPDPATGHTVNNPGYCFLAFASPAHAANALAQVMPQNPATSPPIMPNSSRPYAVTWANPAALPALYSQAPFLHPASTLPPPQPKEYSIFVGDLAPEASNSDLVAVFRNPMLGLRSDREPKFIRPFYSCKSAKIQLDPVTGLSKGYGFVRFTDQAEQQRALIEMHGLYCLSRPMRISPATAKSKAPPYPASGPNPTGYDEHVASHQQGKDQKPAAVSYDPHAQSISSPAATHAHSTSSISHRGSIDISPTIMEHIASLAAQPSSVAHDTNANGTTSDTHASITAPLANPVTRRNGNNANPGFFPPPGYPTTPSVESAPSANFDDAWRQQAQTQALLGTLMGPNGESITSADPYNTTVFVGGLSPLVPEETLRTFFAPFGEIHYVKVPVGKHCGFVQFVHKADAERAIEKMQGFPIGGSKIRLSWGRSQYKAVQAAAAQAVAAAAASPAGNTPSPAAYIPTGVPQMSPPPPPPPPQHVSPQPGNMSHAEIIAQFAARQGGAFTPEQMAILTQLGYGGWPTQQGNAPAQNNQARQNVQYQQVPQQQQQSQQQQQQQQNRRVNGQSGLHSVDESGPKGHQSPPNPSFFQQMSNGNMPRSSISMQSLYSNGGENGGDESDADAAAARISNSVSMSALGQTYSSSRNPRGQNMASFASFNNYAPGGMMNPSMSDSHQSQSYIAGYGTGQQGLPNSERGSPSIPSPYGNVGNPSGGQYPSYMDEHAARGGGGSGSFQISDILRQDSQPLPRTTRGSVSAQGSGGQALPGQSYTPPTAGAIGNKPSVDSLTAAMSNMGFSSGQDPFRRPGGSSIWSHNLSSQPSISPTLARSRVVASSSPHSSTGGSSSDAA